MAVNSVWWMSNSSDLDTLKSSSSHPTEPHKDWPWNQNTRGLPFSVLASSLRDRSNNCCVQEYIYWKGSADGAPVSKWQINRKAITKHDLLGLLRVPEEVSSTFYIVTDISSEVIQALGFYLRITPRFFDFPYTMLSTGNTVELYSFFSLQLMERYDMGTNPAESRRNDASPRARFHTAEGSPPQQWLVTRIALIFMTDPSKKNFKGVVQLDRNDHAIAKALEILMTRDEETLPGDVEAVAGQGQILAELFHIVNVTWNVFLSEAEAHLRHLSVKCVDEDLSPTAQLRYTRELHQLSPLWVQVRRRLVAARDTAKQMIVHPYFTSMGPQRAFEPYLQKCLNTIEDQITRSKELGEETSNLISLIFNITTMQDTRASIAESKSANALAASIRRITVLTFVYLPLTLAAGIFGMNVQQVTGQAGQPPVWWYLVVSACLMATSFGTWCLWSRLPRTYSGRSRRKTETVKNMPGV